MKMKKLLAGLVCVGVTALGLAGCASETTVDEPTELTETAKPEGMPEVDVGTTAPAARQNGDCCNVRCSNGGHITNLWLSSGCTDWARSACQRSFVGSPHMVDAWWGSC
jgi:hypothetical protein